MNAEGASGIHSGFNLTVNVTAHKYPQMTNAIVENIHHIERKETDAPDKRDKQQ
jgi:hypothetical protein